MAKLGPGLRREDKERGIALNRSNASQHQIACYKQRLKSQDLVGVGDSTFWLIADGSPRITPKEETTWQTRFGWA